MKIAFLHIATNNYTVFIEPLITSIEKYFLPTIKKDYFVFTDNINLESSFQINKIEIEAKGFPGDTLYRYHYFNSIKSKLEEYDYIYYLDADMKVVSYVNEEVLSSLLGVQHPGFVGKRGTYETNSSSTAYVRPDEGEYYFCGGFQGGSAESYLKLSSTIAKNIDKDKSNDIMAIWHDESHVNRYLIDNKPTKVLNAGYCAPESLWKVPFKYKIIALDKSADEYKNR
jgi:histo-blood group ABO system transferase